MPALDLKTLIGVSTFKKYLTQLNKALEASLEDADPIIREAAIRHVLAPSKRLRPAMTFAVVHALGKPISKKVITAGCSIELAHISSLIHDDIIDNASSRRGVPTINTQEGNSQAIIIGDYLLAEACVQAAMVNAETSRIVATAVARICDGQSREVADQYNIDRDGELMLRSIRGKTAELFAAACRIGGLCAGIPAKQLDALSSFGEYFGMAFQLIDDVLDFVSSDELLGKPIGNDIVEGVYTMPILLALHGPEQIAIRAALEERKPPTSTFTELLIREYAIGKTIEVARQFNARAMDALSPLTAKGRDLSKLAKLPEAYLDWSLSALVAPEYQSVMSISTTS
jgi:geranylgeranyl pyrophosphate synthase